MMRRLFPLSLLALAVSPLAAQQPPAPRDHLARYRTGITMSQPYSLLTDPLVQTELKLTDEQKAKLAKRIALAGELLAM